MPSYAVYADDADSDYDAGPTSSGAVLRRKWKDYLDRSGDGGRENRGRGGAYNQRSVSPQERAVVEGPGQGVNESGDIKPGGDDELRAMKARSWSNWRDPNPSKHKDPSGSNDTDDSSDSGASSGGSGASSPFARDLKDKGGNPAANKMAAYIDSKTSSAGNWDEQVNSTSLADDVLGNFQKNQRVAAETGETSLNRELAINRAVWDARGVPDNERRDPPPQEEDGPWPPNGRGGGGGWGGGWPDGGGDGGGLGAIGTVAVVAGGGIGLYALATYMGWL